MTDRRRPALSAILVTRNEEKKISRCLDSLRWVDEIVVVDQSSADRTVDIARAYTDKVFVVAAKNYCEPDRPVALSKTAHEWALYLDADECVPGDLRGEIEELLRQGPRYGSYYIGRHNIFLGKWIKGSGWHPSYVLRLFRKGAVKFSTDIHTDVIPLGESGRLTNPIIHYACEDLQGYVQKLNRYTDVLAQQAYARGLRITRGNLVVKLCVVPMAYFAHRFIVKKGFLDGFHGFIIGLLTFLTIFMMNAKVWEIERRNAQKDHT